MSLSLGINLGGSQAITPSGSEALAVVIDGVTYSTAFDTDVETTLDNWIAAHAEAVSKNHQVYAADGTTVLNLYNVDVIRTLTAPNATIGSRAVISQAGNFNLTEGSTIVISGSTVVITRDASVTGSGLDVATFTFASANEAARGYAEIVEFQTNGNRPTANGKSISVPALVVIA